MSGQVKTHWLVASVRALDLPGANDVDAAESEKVGDVWARVREATGLSDAELTQRLADRYLMGVADLATSEQYATRLVPGIVAVKHQILPLRYTDRTLDVATADPHNVDAEREVSRLATRAVRFELAAPDAIAKALAHAYVGSGQPRTQDEGRAAAPPPVQPQVDGAPAPATDERTHVLVVDDDPEIATLLQSFLVGKGFRVTAASAGPEALDLLAQDDSIDAISLDYYMAPMNGLKVLKAIRARPSLDHVPVVVLTSSEDRNIEMSLFESGADDYVVKPLDPPRFFLRLRAVLRRRGNGR